MSVNLGILHIVFSSLQLRVPSHVTFVVWEFLQHRKVTSEAPKVSTLSFFLLASVVLQFPRGRMQVWKEP